MMDYMPSRTSEIALAAIEVTPRRGFTAPQVVVARRG
jgi:hypothetical protein